MIVRSLEYPCLTSPPLQQDKTARSLFFVQDSNSYVILRLQCLISFQFSNLLAPAKIRNAKRNVKRSRMAEQHSGLLQCLTESLKCVAELLKCVSLSLCKCPVLRESWWPWFSITLCLFAVLIILYFTDLHLMTET